MAQPELKDQWSSLMFASDGGGLGAVWKSGDEFYLAKQVNTL